MLREIAEYPNSFSPLGPRDERIETDRFVLRMDASKRANTVQRQRLEPDQIDSAIEEVRALLRARGRDRTEWEVGSSATPEELVDLLLARGLVRDRDSSCVALALSVAPPSAPAEVTARRVETFDEFVRANAVQWEAFGASSEDIAERRAGLAQAWRESPNVMHAAWLGGELVSAGTCAPTEHGLVLFGGATLPTARGRGAYRALIGARWEYALACRTPRLMTQAGEMSLPILTRLGFEAVGHVDILIDEFGQPAPTDGV